MTTRAILRRVLAHPSGPLALSAAVLLALALATAYTLAFEQRFHARDPHPVIYPGREARVMDLLQPLVRDGFAGHPVANIEIEARAIWIQLGPPAPNAASPSCALPPWAHAPGGVALEYLPLAADEPVHTTGATTGQGALRGLRFQWNLCDAGRSAQDVAAALLPRIAARHRNNIWGHADPPVDGALQYGLLTSAIRASRLPTRAAVPLLLLAGLVASLAAALLLRRWDPPRGSTSALASAAPSNTHASGPRRRWWIAGAALGVVVAGASVRVSAAGLAMTDGDEVWAMPSQHPVLTNDHDAWIHPPLFRATQQLWVHATRWERGGSMRRLRAPSLVAGILALGLFALAAARRRSAVLALCALVPFALSADVVSDSVLARPYSLVTLLATIVVVALWLSDGDATAPPRWDATGVALTAAGLATWVDLAAGAALALCVLCAALGPARVSGGARARWIAVVLVALGVWSVPLAPGALRAAREQVHPVARMLPASDQALAGSVYPPDEPIDLRPVRALGRNGPAVFAARAMAFALCGRAEGAPAVRWLCVLGFVAGCAVLFGRGDLRRGVGLILAVGLLVALSTRVSMRSRNVLFLVPLAAAAMVPALEALRAGVARRWRGPSRGRRG